MTKKRKVAHQKVAQKKKKAHGQAPPRAIRFGEQDLTVNHRMFKGEVALIKAAVTEWQKRFPKEDHTFNSFVRDTVVKNAINTIKAAYPPVK